MRARIKQIRRPVKLVVTGFTVLELIVTMSVISILLAILVPAVQFARGAARRTKCQNNMRNLGLAMVASVETQDRYPPSGRFAVVGGDQYANWVVDLLPWLDQGTIFQAWKRDLPRNQPPNQQLSRSSLPVLSCPDDPTLVPGQPNLSYVVNGGVAWTVPTDCPVSLHVNASTPVIDIPLDLNGNGVVCPSDPASDGTPTDIKLMYMMGMCFPENEPLADGTKRHHRISTVRDGLSNTVILSENIRAGYDPLLPDASGWSDCLARRNSFFLSAYICENATCSAGNVNYGFANHQSTAPYNTESLNSSIDQPEGQAPWPSSRHSDGVFFTFADGHTRFVSDQIDGEVYATLLSPQGSEIEGPLRQGVFGSDSY